MRNTVAALVLLLLASISNPAWSHRVMLFAEVENGLIKGEATISGGKKVKHGEISVLGDEQKLLLTASTGDAGSFTIELRDLGLDRPVDLLLVLDAGPGHRAEWKISAASYSMSYDQNESRSPPATDPPDADASMPAAPALKNVVSGILSILGLGALIAWSRSRRRGKK